MTDELVQTVWRDLSAALAVEAPGRTVTTVELVAGGRSAVTAFAQLDGAGRASERVAVRAVSRGSTEIAVGTLRDQFELLELLRTEPVPTPRPVLLAQDVPGTSYDMLVTSYVAGRVPQPWRRAGREEIARLRDSEQFRTDFVETLARIHEVAATRLPPGIAHEGADSAATHSARALARCDAAFRRSRAFHHDPVLTFAQLRLTERRPATPSAAGLVHGDFRLGNLIVDPSGRLCGVLDWELAEAGETLADVAWLCGPQGRVDGHPAGLFAEGDLVTAYERLSGRRVDAELFEHLRLEGTMRTAAVWAQLSAVELERGNVALSVRCQDSTLELVGLVAESLGLEVPEALGDAPPSPLSVGAAELATRVRTALVEEHRAAGGTHPTASRICASFLGRLAGLLTARDLDAYAAACAALAPDDGDLGPGALLSSVLRSRHEAGRQLDAEDAEAVELRRLVAWSARPAIAFGNLLAASTGAAR